MFSRRFLKPGWQNGVVAQGFNRGVFGPGAFLLAARLWVTRGPSSVGMTGA
jgi:hypothetical protein